MEFWNGAVHKSWFMPEGPSQWRALTATLTNIEIVFQFTSSTFQLTILVLVFHLTEFLLIVHQIMYSLDILTNWRFTNALPALFPVPPMTNMIYSEPLKNTGFPICFANTIHFLMVILSQVYTTRGNYWHT